MRIRLMLLFVVFLLCIPVVLGVDFASIDKQALEGGLGFVPVDSYCEDLSQFHRVCLYQEEVDNNYPCYLDGKNIVCPSISDSDIKDWKKSLSTEDKEILQSYKVPLKKKDDYKTVDNLTVENVLYLNPLVKQTIPLDIKDKKSIKIGFGTNSFNITDFYYGWGENISIDRYVELEPYDHLCTVPQSNNMVGEWLFREDARDTSGQDNNGTVSGATHTFERYNFSTDDYISTAFTVNMSNWTFSVWFKGENAMKESYVIDGREKSTKRFIFNYDSVTPGRIDMGFYNGSSQYNNKDLTIGQWYNGVILFNGTHIRTYIDGSEIGSALEQTDITSFTPTSFYMGANTVLNKFLNGSIENVHIWNTSLSASEISTLYSCGRFNTSRKGIFTGGILKASGNGARWINFDYGISSSTGSHYNQTIDGIVSYWKFEGNASDSVSSNHGTVTGATLTNNGKIGKAYQFDGSGNYIDVGDDSSLNITGNITVSAWVYINRNNSHSDIFSKYNGSIVQYHMMYVYTDPGFRFYTGGINSANAGIKTITANIPAWHHIVGVYNSTDTIVYVDGIAGTKAITSLAPTHSPTNLWIGARNATGWNMNGTIDEVAIFNRALNSTEVSQLYNDSKGQYSISTRYRTANYSEVDISDNDLVGYWSFHRNDSLSDLVNETENTPELNDYSTRDGLVGLWYLDGGATDSSGNGNNGVITGATINSTCVIEGRDCYSFDGNDFINVSSDAFPDGVNGSLSLWTYQVDNTGNGRFFSTDDSGGTGCEHRSYSQESGTTTLLLVNRTCGSGLGDGYVQLGNNAVWNKWEHSVWTWSFNGTHTLVTSYLDGVQQNTGTFSGDIRTPNQSVLFGFWAGSYYNGLIDEVKLYNHTLTQTEINDLYNRGSLVGHWKLDGDATDSSYQGNDGTVTGATSNSNGRINGAYDFDGSGDNINMGDVLDLDTNNISISAWVKTNTTNKYMAVVSKKNSGGISSGYHFFLDTAEVLRFQIGNGTNSTVIYTNDTDLIQDGEWHHIVTVVDRGDASNWEIYVDGSIVDTTKPTLLFAESIGNPRDFIIGDADAGSYDWNGEIDDVRVYNKVLTSDEISDLYSDGQMVLHLKMNSNATDSSGYENDGTISGAGITNEGFIKQAYVFDGTNDYIEISDDPSLDVTGDLTITAWIKKDALAQQGTLVSKWDAIGSERSYGLHILNTDVLRFHLSNDGINNEGESSSGTIGTDWTQVGVVFNETGNTVTFYIDGALDSQTALSNELGTIYSSTANVRIGDEETGLLSGFFNGSIDDVRIYARALNPTEIADIYYKTAGTYDDSGNDNDGILQGNINRIGGLFENNDAIKLDGTDDGITTGALGNIGTSSVLCWIKSDENKIQYVYDAQASGGTGYAYIENNNVKKSAGNVFVDGVNASVISVGDWHHIVINGTTINAPSSISIGIKNDLTLNAFNGTIDEFVIYNKSLSQSEITALYLNWSGWSQYYGINPASISANGGAIQYQSLIQTHNITDSPQLQSFYSEYTTTPTTTLSSPTNSYNFNNSQIWIAYSYSDSESDSAQCDFVYNNSVNQSHYNVNTSQSLSFNTQETVEGIYNFFVSCKENVDNGFTSNSSSYDFVYDTTAPLITDKSDGREIYSPHSVALDMNMSDVYGMENVSAIISRVDSGINATYLASVVSSVSHPLSSAVIKGNYTFAMNSSEFSAGTYFYYWIVWDEAGNSGTVGPFEVIIRPSYSSTVSGGGASESGSPSLPVNVSPVLNGSVSGVEQDGSDESDKPSLLSLLDFPVDTGIGGWIDDSLSWLLSWSVPLPEFLRFSVGDSFKWLFSIPFKLQGSLLHGIRVLSLLVFVLIVYFLIPDNYHRTLLRINKFRGHNA